MNNSGMQIESLDHLVLTVKNIEKTCDFYTTVLGMRAITFADNRKALVFGGQKINLHEVGREFDPKALCPTPGSADLCFIIKEPPAEVFALLRSKGIDVLEGPIKKTGAKGPILSIYLNDPDGNLLEISSYIQSEI